MSEATQAGERLRRHSRATSQESDPYDFEVEADWNQYQTDIGATSDEYLRLTDETPIDEAFIQAIGWAEIEGRDTWKTYVSPKSMRAGPVVHITWEPYSGCDGWFVGGDLVPPMETRGQLRMLCAALGIPLPPSTGK